MKTINPSERTAALVSSPLSLWERSVRATHHFLSEDDIHGLAPCVREALREVPILVVVEANNVPAAFMGVANAKIEMLFVSPEARGRGLGMRCIRHAVDVLGADRVDVNEDNDQAVGFYRHAGFSVVDRSETDDQGRPFPLLRMKLEPAR